MINDDLVEVMSKTQHTGFWEEFSFPEVINALAGEELIELNDEANRKSPEKVFEEIVLHFNDQYSTQFNLWEQLKVSDRIQLHEALDFSFVLIRVALIDKIRRGKNQSRSVKERSKIKKSGIDTYFKKVFTSAVIVNSLLKAGTFEEIYKDKICVEFIQRWEGKCISLVKKQKKGKWLHEAQNIIEKLTGTLFNKLWTDPWLPVTLIDVENYFKGSFYNQWRNFLKNKGDDISIDGEGFFESWNELQAEKDDDALINRKLKHQLYHEVLEYLKDQEEVFMDANTRNTFEIQGCYTLLSMYYGEGKTDEEIAKMNLFRNQNNQEPLNEVAIRQRVKRCAVNRDYNVVRLVIAETTYRPFLELIPTDCKTYCGLHFIDQALPQQAIKPCVEKIIGFIHKS